MQADYNSIVDLFACILVDLWWTFLCLGGWGFFRIQGTPQALYSHIITIRLVYLPVGAMGN